MDATLTLLNDFNQLLLIADAAPSLISYVDSNGCYRFVNKAYEVAFGKPRDQLLGKSVEEILGPAYANVGAQLAKGLSGATVQYELTLRLPTRGETVFEVNYTPDLQDDGSVRGLVVVAHDITDRKAREAEQSRMLQHASLRSDITAIIADPDFGLQASLQRCTDLLLLPLRAAFVRIWTFNPAENMLELQASSGIYRHLDGKHSRIPLGALKIGLIAQERCPHVTNDVLHDPRISDREWAQREGMAAFAGYPLLMGRRVVGVIGLFAREPLGAQTLQLLEAIADVLAQGVERKRTEDALRRYMEGRRILAEASAILGNSLDYETTLDNVARLAIPELGDWCTVDVVEDDGSLRRIALAHSSPALLAKAHQLRQKYPINLNSPHGIPEIIRSGVSRLVEKIDEPMLESAELPDEQLSFVRTLKLRSYMGVPLRARGRVIGAIAFATAESGRTYNRTDLAVAEELAARIAAAIDNARLYQAATAREQHMRLFADVSLALANALTYTDTLQLIARLAVATICDYAIIYTLNGPALARAAAAHRDATDEKLLRQLLEQPIAPGARRTRA